VTRLQVTELATAAGDMDHPEAVALGPDGMLYAGGEAGQVYRIDPRAGSADQIADTTGSALGICLDAGGSIYLCDPGNAALIRIDAATGAVERWCEAAGGMPLTAPNGAALDTDGSIWLSDSGTEALDVRDGRLLRVPAGGGDAEVIQTGPLHFPNGVCLGADRRVHWVESFTPCLRRLGERGPELVRELPGVVPDGVALDGEDGFVIACYYPYRLLRVPPAGAEIEVLLDDTTGIHIPMPTNVAFFGDELGQLAIACFGGHEIKIGAAPVKGAALVYP
jgi:gluconolactonase